jgi:hypothetical protein
LEWFTSILNNCGFELKKECKDILSYCTSLGERTLRKEQASKLAGGEQACAHDYRSRDTPEGHMEKATDITSSLDL